MAPNSEHAKLRLLRRAECGLCEDMARDLRRLGVGFDEVDIEQDEALEKAYGELIPVLLTGEHEIARAPQDIRSLKRALRRAGLIAGLP